eukprot:996740_1
MYSMIGERAGIIGKLFRFNIIFIPNVSIFSFSVVIHDLSNLFDIKCSRHINNQISDKISTFLSLCITRRRSDILYAEYPIDFFLLPMLFLCLCFLRLFLFLFLRGFRDAKQSAYHARSTSGYTLPQQTIDFASALFDNKLDGNYYSQKLQRKDFDHRTPQKNRWMNTPNDVVSSFWEITNVNTWDPGNISKNGITTGISCDATISSRIKTES